MATFYWRHLDAVKSISAGKTKKHTIMELAGFSNVIIFATLCLFVDMVALHIA